MKCEYFMSLSTTTNIASLVPDLGKPSMKSMKMNAHAIDGTCRGQAIQEGDNAHI
jgi:hypothetical protein